MDGRLWFILTTDVGSFLKATTNDLNGTPGRRENGRKKPRSLADPGEVTV
jgi:hypothetical protein